MTDRKTAYTAHLQKASLALLIFNLCYKDSFVGKNTDHIVKVQKVI